MKLGRDKYVKCPSCQEHAKHATLDSGNTFGAILWTDGFQYAPMMPRPPPIVKCSRCNAVLWRKDFQALSHQDTVSDFLNKGKIYTKAPFVQEPCEHELYAAIANGGLGRDATKILLARKLAWWKHNDKIRWGKRPDNDDDDDAKETTGDNQDDTAWRENVQALVALLDDDKDDNACILKAEALRELGRFEESLQVLSTVKSDKYAWITRQIQQLCEACDTMVRELSRRK